MRERVPLYLDDLLAILAASYKPTGGSSPSSHPALSLAGGSDPILSLNTSTQILSLGDVATQAELNAHAALAGAHHDPVTAGDGVEVAGQVVAVDLAASSGLQFSAGDLALGTPGASSVSSTNAVTASSHTHAITWSSNPGIASRILGTNSAGQLQLQELYIGAGSRFLDGLGGGEYMEVLHYGAGYVVNSSGLLVLADALSAVQGITLYTKAGLLSTITSGAGLAGLRLSAGAGDLTLRAAAGDVVMDPSGVVTMDPAGAEVLPANGYEVNLGAFDQKWLELHAAELWVSNLVADNAVATIGGRILVAPTTTLTQDLDNASASMVVKHNEMAIGDRVFMEARGQVEFMAITSGPTGAGPYTYGLTRNLDGSGANNWTAGDAVVNLGTTGDGWIDIYARAGISSGGIGPSLVGYKRLSSTYNDWAERWVIGNLDGKYDYSAFVFGFAAGDPAGAWLSIDESAGFRVNNGAVNLGAWDASGNVRIGRTGAGQGNVYISGGAVQVRENTTPRIQLLANGDVILGEVATNSANALWDASAGRLEFRGGTAGTVVQAYVDTSGAIVAGGGDVVLDQDGIYVNISNAIGSLDNSLNFGTPGNVQGYLSAFYTVDPVDTSFMRLFLNNPGAGTNPLIDLTAGDFSGQGLINLQADQINVQADLSVTQDVIFYGNLISNKGGSDLTVYGVHPAATPYTNTGWDGDTKTSANNGWLTANNLFPSVPTAAKAIFVRVSVSSSTAGDYVTLGGNSTAGNAAIVCRAQVAGQYNDGSGLVPLDGSGRFYFTASGSLSVFLQVHGYLV